MDQQQYIVPDWPAPNSVQALVTTRYGGLSLGAFESFNLASHVGDCNASVNANRERLRQQSSLSSIQWLEQVHGTSVVDAKADGLIRTADAVYSNQKGLTCAVLTADCLPLLVCNKLGTEVAAVHAGWRGLSSGVIRESIGRFESAPDQLMAYLGPAIGPAHFEVGFEVLEALCENAISQGHIESLTAAFKPAKQPFKFMADIYQLAKAELNELGVRDIYGGDFCTVSDRQFFSYRRDGVTGRMAALITLK